MIAPDMYRAQWGQAGRFSQISRRAMIQPSQGAAGLCPTLQRGRGFGQIAHVLGIGIHHRKPGTQFTRLGIGGLQRYRLCRQRSGQRH